MTKPFPDSSRENVSYGRFVYQISLPPYGRRSNHWSAIDHMCHTTLRTGINARQPCGGTGAKRKEWLTGQLCPALDDHGA